MSRFAALEKPLLKILDEAIKVDGAIKGNVQVFNPKSGGLQIAAQRGFDGPFLRLFDLVHDDEPSVCSRAFRHKRRVVVSDINKDILFTPYRGIAEAAGFRAVQSTPVIANDGSVQGVFSTHFANVHQLSDESARALDLYASQLAEVIANCAVTCRV